MPRELQDVQVNYISLVSKGANKQNLMLYKSADYKPDGDKQEVEKSDEGFVTKIVKGVMSLLKSSSPSFSASMEKAQAWNSIWDAFYVMQDVIFDIMWSDSDTKKADIATELDAFTKFVVDCIDQYGIKKSADLIKSDKEKHLSLLKSQTGMSPKLLKKFEDSLTSLTQAVGDLKSNTSVEKGEVEDMNAEDIAKAIGKSLEPITEAVSTLKSEVTAIGNKVGALEKGNTENPAPAATETTVEKTADELIKEALAPLTETINAIKAEVSGVSNKVQAIENLRKSASASAEDPVVKSEVKKSEEVSFSGAFGFGK
jgi:archaellum component FlaC